MDNKQKVLCAICEQYNLDVPDIESISPDSLNMQTEVFFWAVRKLENEGYIHKVKCDRKVYPKHHILQAMLPTVEGLNYAASLTNNTGA